MTTVPPDLSAGLCYGIITTRAEAERRDPLIFPPDFGTEEMQERRHAQEAAAFCAGCSVIVSCLKFALVNHEVGIWGGTSTKQRRNLTRRQRRNVRQEQYK